MEISGPQIALCGISEMEILRTLRQLWSYDLPEYRCTVDYNYIQSQYHDTNWLYRLVFIHHSDKLIKHMYIKLYISYIYIHMYHKFHRITSSQFKSVQVTSQLSQQAISRLPPLNNFTPVIKEDVQLAQLHARPGLWRGSNVDLMLGKFYTTICEILEKLTEQTAMIQRSVVC